MDQYQHPPDSRDRARSGATETHSRSWLRRGIFSLHRSTAWPRRLGLDLDQLPMFRDITRLLGVRRVIRTIKAFDPLPDLGKFDLITAFLICFNRHKQPDVWGVPEWEFFLDDLAKHLAPRGRVWLELNQEYGGTFYTPELKEFFQKRGAKIDRHKVIFNSGLPSPSSTSPVAR